MDVQVNLLTASISSIEDRKLCVKGHHRFGISYKTVCPIPGNTVMWL